MLRSVRSRRENANTKEFRKEGRVDIDRMVIRRGGCRLCAGKEGLWLSGEQNERYGVLNNVPVPGNWTLRSLADVIARTG